MSDNTIIIIVAAIPTTIAAIGALIVSVVNARKADAIIKKADEIHVLTNSTMSQVKSALDVANEKIIGLEKLVASMSIRQAVKHEKDPSSA